MITSMQNSVDADRGDPAASMKSDQVYQEKKGAPLYKGAPFGLSNSVVKTRVRGLASSGLTQLVGTLATTFLECRISGLSPSGGTIEV